METNFEHFQRVKFELTPALTALHRKMERLQVLLKGRPAMQQVLALFREALQTKEYQSLKEDPEDPTIQTLHRLALAFWTMPEPFVIEPALFQKILGWFKKRPPLKEVFPFVQGKTVVQFEDHETRIVDVWGGCGEVCPELLALLQGIKNNSLSQHPGEEFPSAVGYTSFQNFAKKNNQRVRKLMELNQRFPGIFVGITLCRHSAFYENRYDRKWNGPESFGGEMKRHLMHGYSLFGREGQEDGGLYFPGDPQEWNALFDGIIEKANLQFQEVPVELKVNADQQQLRGAYQEYVYAMIQSALEIKIATGSSALVIREGC